jgi:GT2 family glycosyltransferase
VIASSNGQEAPAPSDGIPGKAYVVLVNWNGWADTIQCLESVFRTSYPNYQVVVCDNGSEDGSLEHIREWAEGKRSAATAVHPLLASLTTPSVAKPIHYAMYRRGLAEQGGDEEAETARLILIRNERNEGFAAGNNVALRFAQARQDLAYAWILNNDTLVAPAALSALVRYVQAGPSVGICGSTLLYYDAPDVVQTRGGMTYNRWFATIMAIGQGTRIQEPCDVQRVERMMSYPAGASMLVSGAFLEAVGLLSEAYFLYYEELDWVTRAGPRFTLGYSRDSIVYHKEGRSIGTDQTDVAFHRADYYGHLNRLRYTRRFFPVGLPTTVLRTLAAVFARICRGQPRRAWSLLRLVCSAGSYAFPESERERG